MCCARVCRCRAACCAQGGAGKAHRPDRRRRARRDFPRSAKAAYSYVSERSRAATAPGGDPREPAYFVVDEHWSVEHRTPVQLSAVEPVCRSAGGPRAPGREGNIPGSGFEPGSRSGGAEGPPQSVRTRRVLRSPRLRRPGSDRTPLASTGRVPRVRSGVRSGVASAARRVVPTFLILSHVLSVRACGVGPVTRASRIRVAVPTERSHRRGKSKPLRPAGFRIVRGFRRFIRSCS